jgi:hypothetical protein
MNATLIGPQTVTRVGANRASVAAGGVRSRRLRSWLPRLGRPRPALAIAALYALVCLFFCIVWLSGKKESPLNLATALVYLTIRLTGVAVGVQKLWQADGRRRTAADLMLGAFCAAFLLDAAGAVIWLGYNLHGSLVPFPSWADAGYVGDTVLWAVGLLAFFWVLDTNVRDELGSFVDLLAVTWSLTVVIISMLNGPSLSKLVLPAVALSIFYPFVWALSSALAGALLFGPQQRRLRSRWRWFVVFVYAGALLTFLTNIAYSLTAACPPDSPAARYLYYNGGPLDFLFATGDLLLMTAIVLLPLGESPLQSPGRPGDYPAIAEAVTVTRRAGAPNREGHARFHGWVKE